MADDVLDPTELYRVRDGAYAADLLIAAVAEFDVFTWLDEHGPVPARGDGMGPAPGRRAADPHSRARTRPPRRCRRRPGGGAGPGPPASRRGVAVRSAAYYASLSERPAVREFAEVLRTDGQAAWASAEPPQEAGTDDTSDDARAGDWSGRLGDVDFARRITAAMDARGAFLGPALARVVQDVSFRRVLDVGGSSGIYAAALLEGHPQATGAVFERAPVDAAARTLLAERGLAAHLAVVTGDMFTDPLPGGFDVHLYSQVLHDWDAARVEQLLAASLAAIRIASRCRSRGVPYGPGRRLAGARGRS